MNASTGAGMRWWVASAVPGSNQLEDLLAKGWEPFGVAKIYTDSSALYVWLRWLGPAE